MIEAADSEFAPLQGRGRRQAARPAELHRAHAEPDPVRARGKRAKPKGLPAEPLFAHTVPERF